MKFLKPKNLTSPVKKKNIIWRFMFFPKFRDGFFFSKFFLWNKYRPFQKTVIPAYRSGSAYILPSNFLCNQSVFFLGCKFLGCFFLGCFCFCFFLWKVGYVGPKNQNFTKSGPILKNVIWRFWFFPNFRDGYLKKFQIMETFSLEQIKPSLQKRFLVRCLWFSDPSQKF